MAARAPLRSGNNRVRLLTNPDRAEKADRGIPGNGWQPERRHFLLNIKTSLYYGNNSKTEPLQGGALLAPRIVCAHQGALGR